MNSDSGEALRLSIEKVIYPGRRLARIQGRVYFTDEGLPGETVEVEILREHRSFIEARTIKILEPSPLRRTPRCAHFLACGSYQTLPYPNQLELKRAQAAELFGKTAPALAAGIPIVPSPLEWRYRNKIRFSLFGRGSETHLAYHSPGSREAFVSADDGCALASEKAAEIAAAVLEAIRKTGISGPAEIEIRESVSEGTALLNLFWESAPDPAGLRTIADSLRPRFSTTGLVSWIPGKKGLPSPRSVQGPESLRERVAETEYEIGAGSFFQVNTAILPQVIEAIVAAAGLSGRETVADVYGGVGTFGLALSKKAARVSVVESSPDNVRRLRSNIARNNLDNVEVRPGLGERWMRDLSSRGLDVVVLDPPRKGLDPRVGEALSEFPTRKLIYLSCNPSTLARDIGLLSGRYEPVSLTLFDFFPQTPHIETLAVLARK